MLIIFLFLFLNADAFYVRLDLSRNQAFSISDYSRNILRNLPDDVELTYYLSPRFQTRVPAVGEVRDILYEYQRLSRGDFRVEIVNPESDPSLIPEDFGIVPRELQVVENNEQTFALVYSGMTIRYRDSLEVIPFIVSSTNLEYEITSRLVSMTQEQQQSVAVLLAKADPDSQQFQTMFQYLGQYYDLNFLQGGDTIPPTSNGLIVLGMAQLDVGDIYAIEQFILSGKGVLIATESAEVSIQQNLEAIDLGDHPLIEMLDHYGVQIGQSWVLDESNIPIPVQQQQGRVIVNTYQPYPQWVQILGSQTNPAHPLSARFQGLDLFWASPITLNEDLKGSEILFTSSPDAVLGDGFLTDPASVQTAMLQAQNTDGNYPLAVSVNDGLTAWFTEVPEQLVERGITYANPLTKSEESRLLVFGDSDFPSELYQIGGSTYNILLMQSVFEYLVGDEELLEIRTRGGRNTRLDALDAPVMNALLALARILSFGIVPALIVIFAVVRHNHRRKKAKIPFTPDEDYNNE